MTVTDPGPVEPLLEHLKAHRGFDFSGYKRSTIERRLAKRMEHVGADSYERYVDHLEVHPEEYSYLFDTILINVTSFFRDPDAWKFLSDEVVPRILEAKAADEPIRVWSAGCASGEETYTAAMVLAEALGEVAYLERVKIYATDVDHDALETCRQAMYPRKQLESAPPELVERYFELTASRCGFRKDLRRTIIFGRNDLVQDAPISRIDLLLCRNTLMYFNAETQARVLGRFHFALNPTGYLFMGRSEMLVTHAHLFVPISLQRRVFTKVAKPSLRDRLAPHLSPTGSGTGMPSEEASVLMLRSAAFDTAPLAQVIIDRANVVVLANQQARQLVGVGPGEVGRELKDLSLSYRPVELRSHLDALWESRRGALLEGVEMDGSGGDRRVVDVHIAALTAGDDLLGASLTFLDVSGHHRLRGQLETSRQELESSYEELQTTVEELETTNEELQSTNEELETTNEELQSTNEELETTNEELQSTNAELERINEDIHTRTRELNEVNAFVEVIFTNLRLSVIVVDRSLRIQLWNRHSTEMWGLRPDETEGEPLLGLDFGLPVEALKTGVRAALDGVADDQQVTVEATNRRGRAITCEVTILALHSGAEEISGAILLIQDSRPEVG